MMMVCAGRTTGGEREREEEREKRSEEGFFAPAKSPARGVSYEQ
jgi:hypothetical protein